MAKDSAEQVRVTRGGVQGALHPNLRPTPEQVASLRCACGHGPDHFMVSPDPTYTWIGWFTVTFGITTKPKTMAFRCRACGEALRADSGGGA